MALLKGARCCFLPSLIARNARHAARHPDILVLGPRPYCFSLIFLSLICAKLAHLHAHWNSLPLSKLILWGSTFFVQDVLLIFLVRLMCRDGGWKVVRVLAALPVLVLSLLLSGMAAANISFYFVTGAEIHWRRAHFFHRDRAAIKTLLTGLAGFLFVEGFLLTISWFLSSYLYDGTQGVLRILASSVKQAVSFILPNRLRRRNAEGRSAAFSLGHYGSDGDNEEDGLSALQDPETKLSSDRPTTLTKRLVVLLPILLVMFLQCIRPPGIAYVFLSCTLPLSPYFKDGKHEGFGADATGLTSNRYAWLSNLTALVEPGVLHNLPEGKIPGFEDWSNNTAEDTRPRLHYSVQRDPLYIPNLQNDVVEPMREALHNGSVKFKHVILIEMESTRADVFPIRKDSETYNRIVQSHPHGHIPRWMEKRLADLTQTAARLSGVSTGLEHAQHHDHHDHHGHHDPHDHHDMKRVHDTKKRPYGSLSATNAFTASTYTLKSIVSSLCGVSPLVADFNRECENHIYQPCLPQILDLLNRQQPNDTRWTKSDDFTTWPWHSAWMQSVTDGFDNQKLLTGQLGFQQSTTRETLEDPTSKYFPPLSPLLNYYGYQDRELRDYLGDAVRDAEQNHKRLFLTHLTGITHHPWTIPDHETEVFTGPHHWSGMNHKLNRYLNSIGYIDIWLGEILQLLEDVGIANETLLVLAGDHGISLPHDGGITPYDGPNIGNFHVPLIFAHPHLPQINVDVPVTTKQILPTILDLLVESSSLNNKPTQTIKELLPLYEAQSLIRPLYQETDRTADWQFTVMNSGGTWLAVRSATAPYRLVIPLIADMEWRFTDLKRDPEEYQPLTNFDLSELAYLVERQYGREEGADAVGWIADAAHVAQWWVSENWRRWEYSPKVEKLK